MKVLVQYNAEAKDNDKFLNTLERQFHILNSSDLSTIAQCIPSLFNGLRLVYIISRHYKDHQRMGNLMKTIVYQLIDRISDVINLKEILIPRDDITYDLQLDQTIAKMELAKLVLQKWTDNYNATRKQMEAD